MPAVVAGEVADVCPAVGPPAARSARRGRAEHRLLPGGGLEVAIRRGIDQAVGLDRPPPGAQQQGVAALRAGAAAGEVAAPVEVQRVGLSLETLSSERLLQSFQLLQAARRQTRAAQGLDVPAGEFLAKEGLD